MLSFRAHAIAFVLVNGALQVANAFIGEKWWAFWPLVVWGVGFAAHYFVHKSRRVDAAWVEERTDDVRSKSYDAAHIDTIAGRTKDKEKK